MKVLVIFLGIIAAASAVSFYDVIKEEWNAFKIQHQKKYADATEEKFRLKIFMENKHKIAKHNQRYEQGLVSFKLGINKYADMLHHEFISILNGYKSASGSSKYDSKMRGGVTFISPANVELPVSVDWRAKGAVTPVKDQGHCGACWAFSTTGSLEAQHFRRTGVLISLSEQNLVDCSSSYGNEGCNGGLMDNAFLYIKENGGIDTEKSYPYEGIDDSCHFNSSAIGAIDKGFVDIPQGNENKLMEAIATIGPVSVAIDASHDSFNFYNGEGVYYEPGCNSEELSHAILVVGYGTDASGGDYWLAKNSWGTSWGDQGYIKMARNKDNHCGIATGASYPLV